MSPRPTARLAPVASLALGLGLALAPAAARAAAPQTPPDSAASRIVTTYLTPVELAREAKGLEDMGAYRLATYQLRKLREVAKPDADLDLELALDLARTGQLDSARVILYGSRLSAALDDSCPPARRHPYAWNRDELWTNGRYDGWPWYIARARAEVDGRLGRWRDARVAADRALAERPLSGQDWLVLALCSAHAGEAASAEIQARMAVALDPMLPEAQYLEGLFAWRAGGRAEALAQFDAALVLDSLYEPAVRARQRLRFFPGAAADSAPPDFLTGPRAAALLTSPAMPKIESFQQVDRQPAILSRMKVPIADSLELLVKPVRLVLPVLVDERGRPVLVDLPWFAPEDLPPPFVSQLLGSLPGWRFSPALANGRPVASWAAVSITTGQP